MGAHLRKTWDAVEGSFWFVPSLMLAATFALAGLMLRIDERVGGPVPLLSQLLHVGDPDSARMLLSTLSSSMITVAGVTFSIVVVALVLAASQYGSRVIRLFMRDRVNQATLGILASSFTYCILIMGGLGRASVARSELPQLSIAVAVLVCLGSVLVWIVFIHHVGVIMQGENIAASVFRDFERAVIELLEERSVLLPRRRDAPERDESEAASIEARGTGYLTAVDRKVLVRAAERQGAYVRLLRRPGHFVREREPVAQVWPARQGPALERVVRRSLALATQRTYAEDLEFAADQLVQMAGRALSPGINDFFTALACVDWLSAGLQRLARCGTLGVVVSGGDGRPRLELLEWRLHRVVAAVFNPIRQAARSNAAVTIRLIAAVEAIGAVAGEPRLLGELHRQCEMLERGLEALPEVHDRRDALRALEASRAALSRRLAELETAKA